MKRRTLGFYFAALTFAGGCSLVVGNELDGKPEACDEELCLGVADGTDCSTPNRPGRVCVDDCCVLKRCGDGYTDAAASEQCDDGNEITNDGCETDCTFSCGTNADCDDGNDCNGPEECATNAQLRPVCQSVTGNLPELCSACLVRMGVGTVPGQCTSAGVCETASAECP